jgi:hypothetical protein
MTPEELLADVRAELAPEENRVVAGIAAGEVPLRVVGVLAAEEMRIVASDWRSFLTLASRAPDAATRTFFTSLAQGEALALPLLGPLSTAAGVDPATHRPRPGCQAYPAFLAWLALNADPAAAALAVLANFSAWGDYCASIAGALREHHGLDDDACAFFDFFATPAPDLEEQALAAVGAGLDAGRPLDDAREHGRLLQAYEGMFWNSLAEDASQDDKAHWRGATAPVR